MFKKALDYLPGNVFDNISQEKKLQCKDYLDNYEEISKDFRGIVSTETKKLAAMVALKQQEQFFGRVLDIGCGSGFALDGIYSNTRVGLDVSSGELGQIKDIDVTKVLSFAEELPFLDGYFDTVICFNVIEHVLDVESVASEIDRVLHREGMLYLACPWEQNLSVYDLSEYKAKYKQYRYKHLRSIDCELIHNLFPNFITLYEENIELDDMEFDPYSIKFLGCKKVYGNGISTKGRLWVDEERRS